jgi:signal transduction histidine kinase
MAKGAIERSVQNALRASEIVARLRSLVTKEASPVVEFDVRDAIKEILALTATERQRTRVVAKAEPSPEPLMIRGDRIQLQQVLLNLIGNAIEAMLDVPETDRRLWIRSGLDNDGQVRVEIEDRGPGLEAAVADKIFDHLFTTKMGGTGLGLSISKSIITSHGGRIWAEPATPHGAVFRFQLPRSN